MMHCVQCDNDCAHKGRVLEREARLSCLALPEMLRLFFVPDLLFCRHRHEVVAASVCFQALRNSAGSLAIFTAIHRASSLVSNFAANGRTG